MNSINALHYFSKFVGVFIHGLLGLLNVFQLVDHLSFYL